MGNNYPNSFNMNNDTIETVDYQYDEFLKERQGFDIPSVPPEKYVVAKKSKAKRRIKIVIIMAALIALCILLKDPLVEFFKEQMTPIQCSIRPTISMHSQG